MLLATAGMDFGTAAAEPGATLDGKPPESPDAGTALMAIDVDHARGLVEAVYAGNAYETELPVIIPDVPDPPAPPRDPGTPVDLEWLFDLMLVAIAGLLVFVIVREVARRLGNRIPEGGEGGARAVAPVANVPPVPGAERAAADGRWAEAVHQLLLAAIAFLARRRPIKVAVTGREVPDALALAAGRHDALSHLVAQNERGLFGGHPLDAETYMACRAAYDHLTTGRAE